MHLPVSYDRPATTRDVIAKATGAGFRHVILGLASPYPDDIGRWIATELIGAST